MFLALLRTHFSPRYARAKMSSQSGQKHIYAREHQLYCYIIEFEGTDTCKVVSTLDGKIYVRNVKHLVHAPLAGKALIFDDLEDKKIAPEINETVREQVVDNPAIRK